MSAPAQQGPDDQSQAADGGALAPENGHHDNGRPQSAPQRPSLSQIHWTTTTNRSAQQEQDRQHESRAPESDNNVNNNRQHWNQSQSLSSGQRGQPSFVPPLPVPLSAPSATTSARLTSPASAPNMKTLTNHEIYEMMQKQQQFKSAQSRPAAGGRPKRLSLYLANKTQAKQKDLARQNSLIVGTPSFHERYGKYSTAID
jgi:hypothetical protein